jgi:NTE family protein
MLRAFAWLAAASGAAFACVLLGGFGPIQYPINPPIQGKADPAGYRIHRVKADPANPGDVLVVVTFSGGGTRAAALAYGTLEAMREVSVTMGGRPRRLIDEIDIINAVSGGAIVAAYYGVHRERLFVEFEARFLHRDVEGELKARLVGNLPRLLMPRFGRSDLFAEYLDRELFDGRTYADLVRGPWRPFIVINATDFSTGARFPFTQGQFDLLCSDLGAVSLGRSVAASAALPPYFSAITLWNYAGQCDAVPLPGLAAAFLDPVGAPRQSARGREARGYRDRVKRPYIHLVDGGLIDNLGVRAPIDFAIESGGFQELADALGYHDIGAAVFVSVNAETDPDLVADKSADVPSLFQLLKALELPVNAHSFDTVDRLQASIERWRDQVRARRVAAGLGSEGPRFYFIDVSLHAIHDGEERDEFMRIPTALTLDGATVDRLRAIARKLFLESSELARLRRDFAR